MASSTATISLNVYHQQTQTNFFPNNHNQQQQNNRQQTRDISTNLTLPLQSQMSIQQPQEQNFFNQFNDNNFRSNEMIQRQQLQSQQTISLSNESQSIRIKDKDGMDSSYYHHPYYHNHYNNDDYFHGPPSSSPSDSSLDSGDGGFLMVNGRDFMSEIDHACKMLAISADPYNWNQTDVRKWLKYQQRFHQLKSFTINEKNNNNNYDFNMDGMSLCELNLNDFHRKILESFNMINGNADTWNYATILYQELNIWRNAITKIIEPDFFDSSSSSPSTSLPSPSSSSSSLSSSPNIEQQQNYEQFPFLSINNDINNNNKSLMYDVNSNDINININNHNIDNNNNNHNNIDRQSQSPSMTTEKSYCYDVHNNSIINDHQHQQQQQNHQQMFNYGSHIDEYHQYNSQSLSIYDPSSNNSVYSSSPSSSPQRSLYCSSPAGSISSTSSMNINNNNNNSYITNQMQQQQQQQFQQSSSLDHIVQINSKKFTRDLYNTSEYCNNGNGQSVLYQHEHMFPSSQQQLPQFKSEYGSDDDLMSDNEDSLIIRNNTTKSKTKFQQASSMTTTTTSNQLIKTQQRPHGSSTSIQLWQFLKELLSHPNEYENAIRWLERPRGVFKIEDSVRVARLWGQRKNRPAMNYDKLSRSIRQYYKKGIMKKTERAQRLVYQFCQPYAV